MEPTSLSRTLKTMEDKGYIIRTEDAKDKRKVLISLTEAGISMRKIVKDFIIGFNEKIATKVTPKKMAIFLEVINQVDELIDEEYKTLNLQ
jgi:DNA-binding MarR family transcriptional regulator